MNKHLDWTILFSQGHLWSQTEDNFNFLLLLYTMSKTTSYFLITITSTYTAPTTVTESLGCGAWFTKGILEFDVRSIVKPLYGHRRSFCLNAFGRPSLDYSVVTLFQNFTRGVEENLQGKIWDNTISHGLSAVWNDAVRTNVFPYMSPSNIRLSIAPVYTLCTHSIYSTGS